MILKILVHKEVPCWKKTGLVAGNVLGDWVPLLEKVEVGGEEVAMDCGDDDDIRTELCL